MTHRTRYKIICIVSWAAIIGAIQLVLIFDLIGINILSLNEHPILGGIWIYTCICITINSKIKGDSLRTTPPPDLPNKNEPFVEKFRIKILPPISTITLQWIARILYVIQLVLHAAVFITLTLLWVL